MSFKKHSSKTNKTPHSFTPTSPAARVCGGGRGSRTGRDFCSVFPKEFQAALIHSRPITLQQYREGRLWDSPLTKATTLLSVWVFPNLSGLWPLKMKQCLQETTFMFSSFVLPLTFWREILIAAWIMIAGNVFLQQERFGWGQGKIAVLVQC